MKIKLLISSISLLFIMNIAQANTTELMLFNCTWTIPDNYSINKREGPRAINIVSKNAATTERIKFIGIFYDKKEHTDLLNSMNFEKTNIGKYNINFNVFSLHSETHPFINKLEPVIYENEKNATYALFYGFTDEERFKITNKCY